MQRDTFVLTITPTTFSFCKPDETICWASNVPHGLNVTQAVDADRAAQLQPDQGRGWSSCDLALGQPLAERLGAVHDYPRANETYTQDSGTFTFNTPAPAN